MRNLTHQSTIQEHKLASFSSNTEIDSELPFSIGVGGCVLRLHISHDGLNHLGSTKTSPFGPLKIVPQQISSCLHLERSINGNLLAFACGDVRAGNKNAVCVAVVAVSFVCESSIPSSGFAGLKHGVSKARGGSSALGMSLSDSSSCSSLSSSERASSIIGATDSTIKEKLTQIEYRRLHYLLKMSCCT